MKKSITILFALISLTCFSQQPLGDNFYNDQGAYELFWQKVDTTSLTITELISALKQSGNYSEFDISGNQIICQLSPFLCNNKAYGLSTITAPQELVAYKYSGKATFEIKNNRLRCTIRHIYLTPSSNYYAEHKSCTLFEFYNDYKKEPEKSFKAFSSVLNKELMVKTKFKKPDVNW